MTCMKFNFNITSQYPATITRNRRMDMTASENCSGIRKNDIFNIIS